MGRWGGGLHGAPCRRAYYHGDNKESRTIVKVTASDRGTIMGAVPRTRKTFSGTPVRTEPRRRRSPELARQELLDAAERVFAGAQPDQVGLKEVAHEAGVSHALITHYFGTYAGLLEAALARRQTAMRE